MNSDFMKFDERGCFLGQVDPDEYHSNKSIYTVSKSMLHEFYQSPYSYKWRLDHKKSKSSSGFAFGNMVDCMAFTPEKFEETYFVVASKARANTKAAIEQKAEAVAASKSEIITVAEYEACQEATSNLNEHMESEWGLVLNKTFLAQVAFAAKLKRMNGVSLTATGMIDVSPIAGGDLDEYLFDGKTVGQNLDNNCKLGFQFDDFNYVGQAGMYCDGYNLATGNNVKKKFVFLCVESVYPYRVRSVICSGVDIMIGSEWWKQATALYARCLETNIWQGKDLGIKYGITPERKARMWMDEHGYEGGGVL
ncbi:MAG: hypothetical protein RR373_08335 [Akkermansia sp.]